MAGVGPINFLLLLFLWAVPALAQEMNFFGDPPFASTIDVDTLVSRDIRQNNVMLSHQTQRMGNSKFGAFWRYSELANEKKLPAFYNVQFGATLRHYTKDNRLLTLMSSLGSASTKPFREARDNTLSANASYALNERWIVFANYSNNRAFLNNIPLPGFVYVKEQTREKALMVGFPFIYWLRPFAQDQFSIRYVGLLPYNHRLRVLYNGFSWLKPFAGVEQGPMMFFDANRRSDGMRTFWFERRAMVGAEKSLGPVLKVELQAGNSFDREFFNARSFGRKHSDTTDVRDGMYGFLSVKSSF